MFGHFIVQGNGATSLVVDDGSDSSSASYTITSSAIQFPFSEIDYTDLQNVTLQGGGGSDTFAVNSTAAGTQTNIKTGSGTNTVNFSPGGHDLSSIQGPVHVGFSNAPPALYLYDQLKAHPNTYTITSTSTIAKDPATITYDGIAAITLYGAASATYNVESTPTGATYTLNAGAGPNTLNIVPGVQGLVLNGFIAAPLTIDDSSDSGNATSTITASTVQVNNLPPIPYTGAQSLTIKGGSGTDTFNVLGLSSATPVTIDAGSGTNTVKLGAASHSLDGIAGGLAVNGNGSTTLLLDDEATRNAKDSTLVVHGVVDTDIYQNHPVYTITSQGVQRTNSVTDTHERVVHGVVQGTPVVTPTTFLSSITYSNLAGLELDGANLLLTDDNGVETLEPANSTSNRFTILSTRLLPAAPGEALLPGVPVTIKAGDGGDTIQAGDANNSLDGIGSLSVVGNMGAQLILDDEANDTVTPHGSFGGDPIHYTQPTFIVTGSTVTRDNPTTYIDNQQVISYTTDLSVSYQNVADLTIIGGRVTQTERGAPIGNTFDVQGVPASTSATIQGGSGVGVSNTLTFDAQEQHTVGTVPGALTVDATPQRLSYTHITGLNLNNARAVDAFSGPDTADQGTALPPSLTAQERFVQGLYLDALGRVGSKAELDAWAKLFNQAGLTQTQAQQTIAARIEGSAEGRDHLVKSWYLTYLGRQAMNGEEKGWVNLLLAGQTEEQVLSRILGSTEFYQHAQTLSSSGTGSERFAQALYLLLLHRAGSSAEVARWVGALAGLGRHGLALGLLHTTEYRTDLFEGYYNALLHQPDNPGGLRGWVFSNLDMGSVRLGFEASPEFFANG
jgi:hypothetical protein